MALDLDAIEATAKAATPGPWKRLERWDGRVVVQSAGDGLTIGRFQILPDIEYVTALSPTVALALIAELRAARERIADATKIVRRHNNGGAIWESLRRSLGWKTTAETAAEILSNARALGREGR